MPRKGNGFRLPEEAGLQHGAQGVVDGQVIFLHIGGGGGRNDDGAVAQLPEAERPMVFSPRAFAACTASATFSALPLVLRPISTSPGRP